jgi:hypothetical protein
MAKHLRYMGEFLSRAGVVWRVEILQEADEAFAKIGSLDFDADDALVIEWGEGAKEQVICGSTATLKVISPGDRTYEDLYTIAGTSAWTSTVTAPCIGAACSTPSSTRSLTRRLPAIPWP